VPWNNCICDRRVCNMGLKDILPAGLYGGPSAVPGGDGPSRRQGSPMAYSASEAPKKKIEMYSPEFYRACAIGGWMSCGLTHMAVTPLDVVKCSMQVDPKKYKSIGTGFSVVWKEGGVPGLFRGWSPTLVGYGFQGMCKFGFYEYFKKCDSALAANAYLCDAHWGHSSLCSGLGPAGMLQQTRLDGTCQGLLQRSRSHSRGLDSRRAAGWIWLLLQSFGSRSLMLSEVGAVCRLYADMAGAEMAAKYQTPIFLVASASAEVIADVALCPWEAVKVLCDA
jgi:Mitochondrial carrier protein